MISTIGAKVIHRGLRGGNDDRSSPSVNNFGRTISAWSLLPLWSLQPPTKAPASWTYSKRFARFGCGCAGCAALRCIADFQSAGLEMSRSRGKSESPAGWEPCDTADWKSIRNLRYFDLLDKAEMRPS